MTPFGADPQPFGFVTSVEGPTGPIGFYPQLDHVQVGNGWATWSNGYTGDVYSTGGGTTATIAVPTGATAFYFYAEPDPFATLDITATTEDGTSSGPIAVDGFAGARYFGFYTNGVESLSTITVSSSTDFAIGEFGVGGGAVANPTNYVALGDSYSSGEGNPPFFDGTDGPSDFCHRSPDAYSQVVGADLGVFPKFYACSGAVTSDITSTVHDTEPPQLNDPGVDATADLVTMTIGGNDAGFSDVLQSCIEQKLKADVQNAAVGPVGRWLGLGADPSCAHSDNFVNSVDQRIDRVFPKAKDTYKTVLSAVNPVNTSVIVADYPHIFPDSTDEQNCIQLAPWLTNDDQKMMNTAGDRLDGVLREAAGESGVNFVDVRGQFAGHAVCGNGGAYVNGMSTESGDGGSCTWSVAGHCVIDGLPIIGSFHPNASGHRDGYAAAFMSYIDSATARTPAGLPANPAAWPDPAFTPSTVPDTIGTLTATPVTTSSPLCEGTLQAGQRINVSGSGFTPSSSVGIYVTAAGLGATGEQLVATLTADANGTVNGVVRIPLAAKGLGPSDAPVGFAFVDAIGAAPDGSHADDVSMTGLAPHTSLCGAVDQLPFDGFRAPVANAPSVNKVKAGQAVPVKFTVAGSNATLADVVASGYPQSAAVSCSSPAALTTGEATTVVDNGSPPPSDDYNYGWKTSSAWSGGGCRELIVKLVDGTYHRAVFSFG